MAVTRGATWVNAENQKLAGVLLDLNAQRSPQVTRRRRRAARADLTSLLERAGLRLSCHKIDARCVRRYVRAFAAVAEQALSEGKAVTLPGLGTLIPRIRRAAPAKRRPGVTSASPYVVTISFRPSRQVRNIIKEGLLLDIRERDLAADFRRHSADQRSSVVYAMARRANE